MPGDLEAVGDIATGALAAGAVSAPAHGGPAGPTQAPVDGRCRNCGAERLGPYCHRCGQKGVVHRRIGAFAHDLAHGVFHFEGKIWRTLPMLAWRPGELTRRYIDGERARFVSPLALFLFTVFLFFAAASFTAGNPEFRASPGDIKADMLKEIARTDIAIDALRASPQPLSARKQRQLDRLVRDRAELAAASRAITQAPPKGATVNIGLGAFDDTLAEAIRHAQANPALMTYKIKSNAYKFGWALIVLSLPFVWLILIGPGMRDRRPYDHLVFTTYSISFMMLLGLVLLLAAMAGLPSAIIAMAAVLYPPVHFYRHLRGTYGLTRPGAAIRTALMIVAAIITLALFAVFLLLFGLF